MGCGISRDDIVAEAPTKPFQNLDSSKIVKLQKGGLQVLTRIGGIQYGIPPETLKDSINQGVSVPEYYVISRHRFDYNDGISLMEFEFPVYYNFFLRKQNRTKLICDVETMEQIKTIFQETLLGPVDLTNFQDDFAEDYKAIPDIAKEIEHFSRNPFNQTQTMTIDLLLEFILFDENNHAKISKKVKNEDGEDENVEVRVVRKGDNFYVYENQTFLAEFSDQVKLDQHSFSIYKSMTPTDKDIFIPPKFGITVLGSSHGFDSQGSTSGFIIWINGKGVMVDPPPYSSRALRNQHIPPNLIEKIIISHCHADHDSGAFHKIVESTSVEFVSTPTIIHSFLRKYSAVLDMPLEEVSTLFQYRTVAVGHPTFICGARFIFEYSFHSIPAICFEIEFMGKKFFFSGDTFYDPTKLKDLYEKGLFSRERYESLALRDFNKYDMIVHEAGIPPIHTPTSVLKTLSPEIKQKLYLIHIAAKDIPVDSGLKGLGVGLENSVILIQASDDEDEIESNLDLLCSLEIIQWVPFNRISEIIQCFKESNFKAGQKIIESGTKGDSIFLVKKGVVNISSKDSENKFSKVYLRGDYFGESAILSDGERLADIIAVTDCKLLVISKYDFFWIFKYQLQDVEIKMNPIDMIQNLASMRRAKEAEFINTNNTIAKMTENQKCMLNMYLEEVEVKAQTYLWNQESMPSACYIIKTGKYMMKAPTHMVPKDFVLKPGTLIGDFPSLIKDVVSASSVMVLQTGTLFKISKENFKLFIKMYPGFSILCKDNFLIS